MNPGFWVVYNLIPEVAEKMAVAADAAARKAALDCEAAAKALAPVDTGFLKASIYTRTKNYSGYAAASRRGEGRDADAEMFPEEPKPLEPVQAVVAVGAIYGAFVEYGTSKMAAQPYLTPAAEAAGPAYVAAMEAIMGGVLAGGFSVGGGEGADGE